jgi:GxxExxY protein
VIAGTVVVELKAVDGLQTIHQAQLLTYMKLGGWPIGLLSKSRSLAGIKRLVYQTCGKMRARIFHRSGAEALRKTQT